MSAAAGLWRPEELVTTRVRGIPVVVLIAIGAAWALAIAAQVGGVASGLHHDALIHSNLPYGVALVLFLVAWQAMTAAMMLPSSLPLVRLFWVASALQPRPRAAMAAFLGGYALVWSAFGALAFSGDVVVHTTVDNAPWLGAHPWLIAGGVLALAGAFQFSSLKDACLRQCRHPSLYLLRNYQRGVGGAFRLGRGHGLYCLGCCWALMLVAFAAGVANLWWMVALTALMVYEKTRPRGRRAVPVAGITLLAFAALVLAHPGWLPEILGGSAGS
jgi:predicted metal-binding membrane protein